MVSLELRPLVRHLALVVPSVLPFLQMLCGQFQTGGLLLIRLFKPMNLGKSL